MVMSDVVVRPEVVQIDTEAQPPQTEGSVRVRYENAFFPLSAFVWARTVGRRWERVDPGDISPVGGSDIDKAGKFTHQIAIGEVYDVVIYHEEKWDPNVRLSDPEPDGRGTAFGIVKGPEAEDLAPFGEVGAGGTFVSWYTDAREPVFAVLKVSEKEPTLIDGVLDFADPPTIGTLVGDDFDRHVGFELASHAFFQGSEYHLLRRLVDSTGDWQVLRADRTTRLRKITVDWKWIHVVNDGADGHNQASFQAWMLEGATTDGHIALPLREITDRPSPGEESMEWIDLSGGPVAQPQVVIGPKAFTSENRQLLLLTRGIADATGEDDRAGNFLPGPGIVPGTPFEGAEYAFPIGSDLEAVKEDQHFVDATPLNDGEFAYSVEIAVTVEYPT
jgi:hypothetical protein